MACCVLAAFLIAQMWATLRRWGVFWGIVPRMETDAAETVFTRIRDVLATPRAKIVVAGLLAAELVTVGGWVYTRHGTHIYQIADQSWSALHGQHVVYVGLCKPNGSDGSVRVVLADAPATVRPVAGT
jgi:hypothetical protein